MNDESYVRAMLAAIGGKVGTSVTVTFAGGSAVTGVLTEGTARPDDFHVGGERYLVGSGGTVTYPNWSAVVAVSYAGS